MATTTPRIGLTKPDGTDLVDIAVLNTNFDKIDSNIASTKIQSTKPTTANAGDLWWDSDTGTLYLYYTDANSSQWVAATSDPINIGVVANQTERDAQYPTPQQGMSVYRLDLGTQEIYYGLYNVSTNPGGKTPAGWYPADNFAASSLGVTGSNGYVKLRNGLIIQWGAVSGNNNVNLPFTLPIAFPTAILGAQAIVSASSNFSPGNKGTSFDTFSTTTVSVAHDIPANTFVRIIAIGY